MKSNISKEEYNRYFELGIERVIFNPPATVVFWHDGTKTVVKVSENDIFDSEKGLAMAIIKKVYGNDNTFHKIFKKYDTLENWSSVEDGIKYRLEKAKKENEIQNCND